VNAAYVLDWYGASSAEVDLRMARDSSGYLLRYNSPFRATMRAPSQEIPAGPEDLEQIGADLDLFAGGVSGLSRGGNGVGALPSDDDLIELGRQIFDLTLPPHVRAELRKRDFFLEIGTDDSLLHYPWELMHDGEDFLCLKHFIGRFVNLQQPPKEQNGPNAYGPGSDLGELRVLVISVPQPVPRGGFSFPRLVAAEREADAIVETLTGLGLSPVYLGYNDATRTKVLQALREPYHIIHFAGHAIFHPEIPRRSALVLQDENVGVGALTSALRDQRSVLCVVNGCETTRAVGTDTDRDEADSTGTWTEQYNIYGLARAFLETGSYLLGSRWKLHDQSAGVFAQTFYSALLGESQPIGQAITTARAAVKEQSPSGDFSWASYVYYGDPRMCLSRAGNGAPPAPSIEAESAPDELLDAVAPLHAEVAGTPEHEPFRELAREYEATRATMPFGFERTRKMSDLVTEAKKRADAAGDCSAAIEALAAGGDGERVITLALIEAQPNAEYFGHVLEGITSPNSAFEQYHALVAAKALVPLLDAEQKATLQQTLTEETSDPTFYGTDRHLLASDILTKLGDESSVAGNPNFV
jgi:CHAT domain